MLMSSPDRVLWWMPLDNAAKVYPAARTKKWTNVFRLSVTLTEPVDVELLQDALDLTVNRFPSMAARLRRGMFWYYLQEVDRAPLVQRESSWPLTPMGRQDLRNCAFRVIVYRRRIAVEFFHSLTDGNGGLVFLKTLTAEYLRRKYGVYIPASHGILDLAQNPQPAEYEDSFQKYGSAVRASRKQADAWRLSGTPEPDGFHHVTCLRMQTAQLLNLAHSYGVSLTAFLTAVMMQALLELQKTRIPNPKKHKPIKVIIPVNLRKLFPSQTLRNFVLYTTPEVDPQLGDYDLQELCRIVHHQMRLEITPKHMRTLIATNLFSERVMAVRVMPLFIKNFVIKAVYNAVGERKSCLCISNLGQAEIPAEMVPYVERFDFILGVQATGHHNCGVISYGDTLYFNLIRNVKESDLEYHFFKVLRELGVEVTAESNRN